VQSELIEPLDEESVYPRFLAEKGEGVHVFYTRVLGLEEGKFGGGYIGFGSGQAQVVFAPPGVEPVLPDMGVDVDSRGAVDAAHAEAVRVGHEVICGPVDEPWGVRRFFVRDPHGVVISVLGHEQAEAHLAGPARKSRASSFSSRLGHASSCERRVPLAATQSARGTLERRLDRDSKLS
jgi:catechol 2,3-dioxygenase-like lactoylglutathione lyase family enzyme